MCITERITERFGSKIIACQKSDRRRKTGMTSLKCPKCGASVLVTHYGDKYLKCPVCKKSMRPKKLSDKEQVYNFITSWEKNIRGEKQTDAKEETGVKTP
jgi:uncharacterized Zn finger protein (UPF0148 family)